MLRILEKEIALRDETRELEQARATLENSVYSNRAKTLATTQEQLAQRVAAVTQQIRALKNGPSRFPKQIRLLGKVQAVMRETTAILATPNTGPEAVGAETEAIELLLQTKRANPNSSGGGGSIAGGGGSGTTSQAALALIGDGSERSSTRLQRRSEQQIGADERELPAEFRQGLDAYFSSMEQE